MKKYKLGELLDVKRGASVSGEYFSTEGNLIRLTLGNFDYQSNGFKENKSKDNIYYIGDVADEFILEKNDIITPLTEQALGLLGSTAKIPESGKYIQTQDTALVKVNPNLLYHGFAYYLLPTPMVKKQLSAGAQQTSIRHTSPDKIKDCSVYIPELVDQKNIANFLENIEAKISLNRKANELLESIAKQLYDYWFVQFDFPNEEGKPYKSSGGKMVYNEILKRDIPEGWEVVRMQTILDQYPTTKRFDTKEYQVQGVYPIIDQSSTFIVGYTDDEEQILNRFPAVVFGDHSLNVKFINFAFARGADGTQILYSNNECVKQYYLYLYVKSLNIPNPGYARHFKYLKELPIIIPSLEIASHFENCVKGMYKKSTSNIQETLRLTSLRDYLLPLLMNGQVKVS